MTNRYGAEVDRLVYALMNYKSPGSFESEAEFYFDHQTGEVVLVCYDADVDEREGPSKNNRYGRIESLSANVRETRSTQRIRVGRRQRKRTCWDCERENGREW